MCVEIPKQETCFLGEVKLNNTDDSLPVFLYSNKSLAMIYPKETLSIIG